jgi:hypothetical protein
MGKAYDIFVAEKAVDAALDVYRQSCDASGPVPEVVLRAVVEDMIRAALRAQQKETGSSVGSGGNDPGWRPRLF